MAIKKRKAKSEKRKVLRIRLKFVLPIFLILFGVALIGYASFQSFDFSLFKKSQNDSGLVTAQKPSYSKISSITIPKIKKTLNVEDGKFENGRWQVSAEGVSFYTGSNLPEKGGNTVLYGHNKARILGGLVVLKRGDKIELAMENGEVRNYEVSETKTIKPTDVSILSTTKDTTLTIYTCSGFLDTARFVVLAKPLAE